MNKTMTFVTNQYSCDRIIYAAREIADNNETELVVVEILNSEYELNPQAIDYLFKASKRNKATMRMLFTDDKIHSMIEVISQYDCKYIITGMPDSNQSILYDIWKMFPEKEFFVIDPNGNTVEVAGAQMPAKEEKNAMNGKVCPA